MYPISTDARPQSPEDAGRLSLLVVANETVGSDLLHEAVVTLAAGPAAQVTVVAPALNGRLRHLLSDEDGARRAAEARLIACVQRLRERGVAAGGWVGDADPLRAIEDVVRTHRVDALVIATHPEERSNWLAHDLVGRATRRFRLPTTHVVADARAHREWVAARAVVAA